MKEENEYILGTDQVELHRLGLQHQIWASEAQKGWELAGFKEGHAILDLGCGPGFCSKELAFIVGQEGHVLGVDRSQQFIQFLKQVAMHYNLKIDAHCKDFNDLTLKLNHFDGMFCRWALAWISNPKVILTKIKDALKIGGKMVLHEYYDWSTHKTEPQKEGLNKAIAASLRSFKEQEGEIDIGRFLPEMLEQIGMKIISKRLMTKLGRPNNLVWQWPKSFYYSYFSRLVSSGYLTKTEADAAINDFRAIEKLSYSTLFCPTMIEIVAEKV